MSKEQMRFTMLAITALQPDPQQPRQAFPPEEINALAADIKRRKGIHTPLIVVQIAKDAFLIVDGHRRYYAAPIAGLTEVPCVIQNGDQAGNGADVLLTQLSTDLTRQNFSVLELGSAAHRFVTEFGWTLSLVALRSGKDLSQISRAYDLWCTLLKHRAILDTARTSNLSASVLFALAEALKRKVKEELVREVADEAAIARLTAAQVRTLLAGGDGNGTKPETFTTKVGDTKVTVTYTDELSVTDALMIALRQWENRE